MVPGGSIVARIVRLVSLGASGWADPWREMDLHRITPWCALSQGRQRGISDGRDAPIPRGATPVALRGTGSLPAASLE